MKNILLIYLLLISILSFGQTTVTVSQPYIFNKTVKINDTLTNTKANLFGGFRYGNRYDTISSHNYNSFTLISQKVMIDILNNKLNYLKSNINTSLSSKANKDASNITSSKKWRDALALGYKPIASDSIYLRNTKYTNLIYNQSSIEGLNRLDHILSRIDSILSLKAYSSSLNDYFTKTQSDSRYLQSYTETDPTIYAWAKASTKPTYTYSEVGAEPTISKSTGFLKWNGSAWVWDNSTYLTSTDIAGKADTSYTYTKSKINTKDNYLLGLINLKYDSANTYNKVMINTKYYALSDRINLKADKYNSAIANGITNTLHQIKSIDSTNTVQNTNIGLKINSSDSSLYLLRTKNNTFSGVKLTIGHQLKVTDSLLVSGANISFGTGSKISGFTSKDTVKSHLTGTHGMPSNYVLKGVVENAYSDLRTKINAKQTQLNGTGFVKASGTTISYDNSTYATTTQLGAKSDTSNVGLLATVNTWDKRQIMPALTLAGQSIQPSKDSTVNTTNYLTSSQNGSGFSNNENISMSYDATNRTVTLTGTYKMYWKGKVIQDVTTSWTSSAHSAGSTVPLYLKYNGSGYSWSSTAWTFDEVQIAYVAFNASGFQFAVRECHGLMDVESHRVAHNTIGTFKVSGGDFGSYATGSTTTGDRRPTISLCKISDEDLITNVPAISDDKYTRFFLSGTNTANFTQNSNDIDSLLAGNPYYNNFTGGNWIQTLFPNNAYGAIFLYASPTTTDYKSYKRRLFWVQPQQVSNTLATIQALTASSLNLGDYTTLANEFVPVAKVIVRYTASNWVVTSVESINTNRVASSTSSTVGLTTVTTDGTSTTGSGIVGDPVVATGTFSGTVTASTYTFTNAANVSIGNSVSGASIVNGNNIIIGNTAGNGITTGVENVVLGANTTLGTSTTNNVVIGASAKSLTTSGSNVFIGRLSGNYGDQSVGIGQGTLSNVTNGNGYNVAIGYLSGYGITGGLFNALVGNSTGQNLSTGGNNAMLGYRAGYSNNVNGCVFLGYNAGYNESTDNKLYIANSNTATPLIYGEFDNNKVTINGTLQAKAPVVNVAQAGGTLTINLANSSTYQGAMVRYTGSGALTITLGNDLPSGFYMTVLQESASQITVGGTVTNIDGTYKSRGQNAEFTVHTYNTGTNILSGDVAP